MLKVFFFVSLNLVASFDDLAMKSPKLFSMTYYSDGNVLQTSLLLSVEYSIWFTENNFSILSYFRLRLRVCPKVSEASCFCVLCNISYMVYDIRLVRGVFITRHSFYWMIWCMIYASFLTLCLIVFKLWF